MSTNIRERSICFINSNRVWGGGEKWHYEFSQLLQKEGYRVFAVSYPKSDLYNRFKESGIHVFSLKISNYSFLRPFQLFKLYNYFRKNKIETVILGLSSDVKVGGLAAKLAGLNKIYYRRGSAVPVKSNILNRFLFRNILTGVIANSLEIKKAILHFNNSLIAESKIHLLYNCIDFRKIPTHSSSHAYPVKMEGEIWIGNVGRLVEQKGQRYLIELAGLLKNKGIRFKLLIAGKGKLENELKSCVISQGLENEIYFLGFISDIEDFFQKIDIFILSSIHEGSANVLLEAMANSKPVVAFEVSSIGEIVEHEHTGFLAQFKDVTKMADLVIKLIEDQDLRIQMGLNGKKRVMEKFHVEHAVEELKSIIE